MGTCIKVADSCSELSRISSVTKYWMFACTFILCGQLLAEEEQPAPQAQNVLQAMKAEADGDFLTRQRLLVESQDFAPARWQAGEMLEQGEWKQVDAAIQDASEDALLDRYEQRRASLSDNIASHFALATWCAKQKLYDQSRSHLHRVLAFDPENVRARRALGFQSVNGEWMGPNEVAELAQRTQFATKSLKRFGPRLEKIKRALESKSLHVREQAIDDLCALEDVQAVPAVESVFANAEPRDIEIALAWLGGVDTLEASQALARFSLFHPQQNARTLAQKQLASRPLHDFVPDMLKMLESPVSTMIVPTFDPRSGNLTGYRQAFAQETIDRTDVQLVDRVFQRVNVPMMTLQNGLQTSPQDALWSRRLQELTLRQFATGEMVSRTIGVRRENQRLEQRNARVADTLSAVSGREFLGNPKQMWDWWDDYNETKYQSSKPERYRRTTLASRVPVYTSAALPTTRSCECFVAGTSVVTRRGPKPIQNIVVGDQVLSRNVLTGQLDWKPVLRSTTRPPEKTITIQTDTQELTCTGGHLFWVSGKGWRKASELDGGNVLHAAGEPAVVMSTSAGAILPTFNLEVADNATYFVGESKIMTHDVTPRAHNRLLVPGEGLLNSMLDAERTDQAGSPAGN